MSDIVMTDSKDFDLHLPTTLFSDTTFSNYEGAFAYLSLLSNDGLFYVLVR